MRLPGFAAEASLYGRQEYARQVVNVDPSTSTPHVTPQLVILKYHPWLVRWFHCAGKHSAWPTSMNPPGALSPAKPGRNLRAEAHRRLRPA